MFTTATFDFLRDLRANNTKPWFEANKARWEEHGRAPLLAFVRAMKAPLQAISPHYVADDRPNGGSMFRIYRDTRFSKDKSPYKTHLAAQFRHAMVSGPASEVVHAPGFYFNLAPDGSGGESGGGEGGHTEMDGVFGGFGTWRPDGAAAAAIRGRIAADPGSWRAASGGLELGGEQLKRVPAGFDKDHPLADDLRRKDFIVVHRWTEADAVRPDFVDAYVAECRRAAGLQRFLCGAVGLPF